MITCRRRKHHHHHHHHNHHHHYKKPLRFIKSIPANGAVDFPARCIKNVELIFNQDVVSNHVWEKNKKLIKMWRGMDRIHCIVTRKPDVSEEIIFVRPAEGFRPHSKYTILIDKKLKSSEGSRLGKNVVIIFRTI